MGAEGKVILRRLSIPFLVFLFFFSLVLYPYLKNWKKRRALSKIPGPPLHGFFLGNIPDMPKDKSKVMDLIKTLVKDFGDQGLFRFFIGPFPTIEVFDPALTREIMGTSKHSKKNFIYDYFPAWLGDGLLLSWGPKWKTRRRLITPAFHFEVLQRFLEVMNEQSDVLIQRLEEESEKGEELDAFQFITACALDIICETAMGRKVNAQSKKKIPYVDAVFKMSYIITERFENLLYLNDFTFSFTGLGKESKRCLETLHSFTLSVIKERKALLESQKEQPESQKKKIRPAFLDILLKAEVDGKPLSLDDIREEVDTFMFEGHDTTSASMAWTVQLVGSHPEVQERLQNELDEIIGDEKEITLEMMGQMKYLDMITKESLRLYPSVPVIGRQTTEDITFKGHFIPKGTEVNVSILGLHRNPKYWENPESFLPERWNPENEAEIEKDPFLYVPFSAGPRNCIGQKFAQNEEKLILAKIFHKFKVTSSKKEVKAYPEVILRPNDGIWVSLEKRS